MTQASHIRALFLSEWYPHRYDAMSGLFVRKHAVSVADEGVDVCVLFFLKDSKAEKTEIADSVFATGKGHTVREICVYYKEPYLCAMHKGWQYVRQHWGRPDLCQLQVITKNAMLPLWLKMRYGIPYIVVEHWTGYLPSQNLYKGFFHKRLAEAAVSNAFCIMPVSRSLRDAMIQCGLVHDDCRVICNVVDDFFFDLPRPRQHGGKRFLHISCFDEQHKNVKGILDAIKKVSQKRQDFQLVLVGVGPDYEEVRRYAATLALPQGMLVWKGELQPRQVAEEFADADCFVLFSNYENAPVVISESLAAGVPVISSDTGFAAETIDRRTGVVVPPKDENALADALERMLDDSGGYDTQYIRSQGAKYRSSAVGKQLTDVYKQCLQTTPTI